MTGYEDLDDLWPLAICWRLRHRVGAADVRHDWAPYRYGHWAYVESLGLDLGRRRALGFCALPLRTLGLCQSRWCWVPGPVAIRPVYAPALVAFVGGVGISIGGGPGVGWFPLAPGEVYMPYYRGSRGYVERINVTNTVVNVTRVTNVYNVYNSNQRTNITYMNQRVNNGVTLVSRDTFVNARPVGRNLGHYDARQLAEAPVERTIQVQPVRTSVMGSGMPARFRPPQAVISRQVIATQRPAPPRQPFGQGQTAPNIRTEQPSAQPRPMNPQGVERPEARPQRPAVPAEGQGQRTEGERASQAEMPRPDARPQQPQTAPRAAEPPHPPTAMVPRQPQGGVNQNDNRVAQGWSHPQAKPAPPVQERSAAQARDDENKFRNWQQQRPPAAPAQNRAPQVYTPERSQEHQARPENHRPN